MGVEVARPLRLKRSAGRPAQLVDSGKPRWRVSVNGLMGMGLWVLLWLGYNTDIARVFKLNFPANNIDLIHGIRAFSPPLAAWTATLMIFTRARRLFFWLVGPLGLMLFFATTGLVSSATLSDKPIIAVYYAINYLAIVLVLLAIALVEDPLPDLLKVLQLTWGVGTLITLGLLGAIPILGSQVIVQTESTSLDVRAYTNVGEIMGMASTRNTGFARYAAVSALVAFCGVFRKGSLAVRVIWGILLGASVYALFIANGRTEILGFLGGLMLILGVEKSKRVVSFMVVIAVTILLGIRGFYSEFFLYLTRTGSIDLSLTGRTHIWQGGWRLLWQSPWVGLGFQADRIYGVGHMHNAFLHVLVQSGFVGGLAIIIGIAIVWYYTIQYFFINQPADKSLIPAEIPAVLLFTTISSITESTFAYFSAAWLLCAPIVPYVMALHRRMQTMSRKAAQERGLRIRLERRNSRLSESPVETPRPTSG